MDFAFLKDRYDYELLRREQLTAALALPVGILSVLGGATVAMARSFSYLGVIVTPAFGVLLAATGISFFLCLLDLGRAYHRQKYLYLPLLSAIEQSREEFMEYGQTIAGGDAEVMADFEKELRRRVIEAADRNTRNNDDRSRLLYWARIELFVVLALTAAAGIPYVVDQVRY